MLVHLKKNVDVTPEIDPLYGLYFLETRVLCNILLDYLFSTLRMIVRILEKRMLRTMFVIRN